ncbi:uracil-DNA glycosylase family protein [Paenibacillus sp. NPDC058071]|uniref:uracil-DNA glycosylase family protein n=1 Tax=Paenibacillus sp. NPDC058071 TaxID=3346326 RepID=UPI0036DB47AC
MNRDERIVDSDYSLRNTNIERYKTYIGTLPEGKLTKEQLLVLELQLAERDGLSVYYIPFEYVNERAKVMVIGITPGFTQMELAYRVARSGLHAGLTGWEIARQAKAAASFAGTMRRNLYAMLDGIGLPESLGIDSAEALFEEERERLLHTTSAIRFPVFQAGRNYTGHQPELARSTFLMSFARSILLDELASVPGALLIPLGKSVEDVLLQFAAEGLLDPSRCLFDLPHPSGANGHRHKQFEARKEQLALKVSAWFAASPL